VKLKHELGWWWPADEKEAIAWMRKPQNVFPMNGRHTYQGRKQAAALNHCPRHRVAVDIGSHIGLWAYNLAHEFSDLVCFEPVKTHRECFEKNMGGLMQHVTLHACALGAEEGTCTIKLNPGVSGDSQVRPGTDVPLKTLDSFGLVNVDLIKVDAEGFEENILKGGEATIKRWMPTIAVEQKREMATRFGLKPQGAIALLESWGYKVAEHKSGDYVMVPA
jgi:FkbM family methyltransferase